VDQPGQGRAADQGDRLGYEELVTYCGMLLNAASDTTRALIGDATAALLADPALLARVRADTSLIPAVVEESMRHDSPLLRAPRVLVDDVELHGTTLPRGDLAFAIMASANRDPRVFDDPDRFDIDRPNVGANVGFGSGRHLCIGAAIARLEAEVAIERLLANFPDLTLAAVSWRPLHLVRSPEQVAISVGARP
jgi:cytochrome P450